RVQDRNPACERLRAIAHRQSERFATVACARLSNRQRPAQTGPRARPLGLRQETSMLYQRPRQPPQPRADGARASITSALRRTLLTFVLVLGAACAMPASVPAPVPSVQPLQVDAARLHKVVDWLKDDVAKNRYPGAVVLVMRDGKVLLHEAVGWAD